MYNYRGKIAIICLIYYKHENEQFSQEFDHETHTFHISCNHWHFSPHESTCKVRLSYDLSVYKAQVRRYYKRSLELWEYWIYFILSWQKIDSSFFYSHFTVQWPFTCGFFLFFSLPRMRHCSGGPISDLRITQFVSITDSWYK